MAQATSATAAPTVQRSPLFGDAGGSAFDDPVNTETELTAVTVKHGYWIDSVQAHTGTSSLPAHGGSVGIASRFTLARGEYLVAIHGRQGANSASPAISQISFVTNKGHVYGPYGQGLGQGQTTPFHWRVPYGGRIVGFSGRAGQYLNAIGAQYVVETSASPVVASAIVGAPGGVPFTDTVATDQRITGLWVRHGSWIDGIQAQATPADLPLHGGASGQNEFIGLNQDKLVGNSIVRISGLIGSNPSTPAIAQLAFETAYFKTTWGPYGLALGQNPLTPFQLDVPVGHRLVGFTGRAGTYLNAIGLLTQREDPMPVLTSPVFGSIAGTAFADPVSAGQWMHGFTVRHGGGIDGIQGFESGFALPAHGRGGNATTIMLDPGEYLVGMFGGWGTDIDRPALHYLSFRTNRGRFFGPFGNDQDPTGEFFSWEVPFGGRIVGFAGREGQGAYLNAFGVEYVLDMKAPVTEDSPPIRVGSDSREPTGYTLVPGEWLGGVGVVADQWVRSVSAGLCRDSGWACGIPKSQPDNFRLDRGEMLVRMYGLLGANASNPSVAQISFESNWGRTFGPYGAGLGQDPTTPFDYRVPPGTHMLQVRSAVVSVLGVVSLVAIDASYEADFLQATTSTVFGSPTGFEFHDQVATGQTLTGVRINHGQWIDAIQGLASPHDLARHGGHGGRVESFDLQPGEYLVRIYGLQGGNTVAPSIAQVSFQSNTGRTFGPYGTAAGQEPTTPFDYKVPPRGRIVGFSGRADQYLNAIGVQFVVDRP